MSSGASSGVSAEVMDQRKRKRMLSNRESARRSRQRKRKQLDELTAQVSQLREANAQMATALDVTRRHYFGVEAENSVLRARVVELGYRLQSLNEIFGCMSSDCSNKLFCWDDNDDDDDDDDDDHDDVAAAAAAASCGISSRNGSGRIHTPILDPYYII